MGELASARAKVVSRAEATGQSQSLVLRRSDAYEADIFEVDGGRYVAIITNGKGEIPNGTKIPVPNHKMKWDEGNPTGHGIIFIGVQGQVYCYVAPGGV